MTETDRHSLRQGLGRLVKPDAIQKIFAFTSLVALLIFFTIASPNFARFDNLVGIMLSTAVIGVMAIGVTFVIISGGIDLSIGTVMTFSSVMTGVFITNLGCPLVIGIIGGILAGAVCGLINGTLVSRLRIPPFIATLGMMMVAKGLSLVISGTKPIYFMETPGFRNVAMGSLIGSVFPGLDIPNAVLIFLAAACLAAFILKKTVLGLYVYAIGSNEEAARLSGIPTRLWQTIIYVVSGLFCGLAGVLMAARLNSAQPALGQGYELEAIAAVVIGGTSLSGGEGSIVGTVIGALLMSVLTNGLRILSVPQEWQMVIIGSIVIAAVYADTVRRSRKRK